MKELSYTVMIRASRERVWDGIEDTESESARKWIGCTETYELREVGGGTELRIIVSTHEDYEKMFNDCWPKALELLKDICERE
jgi:hypothetical protein